MKTMKNETCQIYPKQRKILQEILTETNEKEFRVNFN